MLWRRGTTLCALKEGSASGSEAYRMIVLSNGLVGAWILVRGG